MDFDYKEIGFRAGIEIHQELNTKKLFCGCSSSMREEKMASETRRKLRAAAGETGKVDSASAYEQIRDREFVYHSYDGEVCLVELDEEPPHNVNHDAFQTALCVAKLLKLNIPDTICVMRKTVTDGSAVSGFQRTMLVGQEGKGSFIETPKGKAKIVQLNLEEDASRIEKKEENKVHYSLSRLGIPLLEIGTDASLKDPEHVKEAALEIGTLLRSFNVKRGIGTIRQDVNVSIKGGARIEVKGWQDLKKLKELVENEAMRQYALLEIKKELEKKGLKKFEKKSKEVTSVFKSTESKIISELIEKGGEVHALVLPKFSGLLKKEICTGKTLGRELSEYGKIYGTKGMIHKDENLTKYKLEKEFNELKKNFKVNEGDLILIVAEKRGIAEKAIDAVYERALFCLKGVPEETRVPNHDNATSSFARPLPGAHRLYPETDIPNINVSKKFIESIRLPELITEKIERLAKEYDLDKNITKELIRGGYDFEDYVKRYKNIKPKFIAHTLIEMPKEIIKRFGKEIDAEMHADKVFDRLNKKEISKDAVFEILAEIANGKKVDYEKYILLSDEELEREVKRIIEQKEGLAYNALVGKVMERLRGRTDGKRIVETIKKCLNVREK